MTAVIEAEDLSIGWSPELHLLDHATFAVERGEIFGILGRSASGKSTLFRALVGLEAPLAGSIRIGGIVPRIDIVQPAWGVMFQQGALIGSLSVGDNIALPLETWTDMPADAIRAVARAKLGLVGLEYAIDRMPSELSGGMRKRASLARALALDPSLLFLDEPSSGLDPITSAEIDRLIRSLAAEHGLTVVLVTHELGSINSIVDRCIMLDATVRSIVATGRPHDLAVSENPHVRNFFLRIPEAA